MNVRQVQPMSLKHTLTPEEARLGGIVLIVLSIVFLVGVARYFEQIRRSLPIRWGRRGRWSFPTSRMGAASGGILAFVLGAVMCDMQFTFIPKGVAFTVISASLAFVFANAVRDFVLHRRQMPRIRQNLEEAYASLRSFRAGEDAEGCYSLYREELGKKRFESALKGLELVTEDCAPPPAVSESVAVAAEGMQLKTKAARFRRMKTDSAVRVA
jgi:hypothetical protein